ncbi:MAG: [Fe-S]-binding protein [Chloroflexi bacterium GWB2_49_20]|nr:MAG: [Fe-S]-binding protein [Chloroflexi bacterium GWB2_49_20]OGN79516.1 MAG: [Fe-S]-binding protein [Chloroflexi bacterium GWC2_49_37]OGN84561.1 MAG: [Fe-S]-binding protein [Chloroflexi bacterium GWD2_49_16]HCC78817.1 [Fe-S]-binding protein [Anaerolineae bacterium]HCM97182.1 [Fe-S]-binding protein [Anaerolineae bacterium]
MLQLVEKILFACAVAATLVLAWFAVKRLVGLISGGQGKPDWKIIPRRLVKVLLKVGTFQPVFRFRLLTSIFHALVGWGFGFYLLVNVVDVLRGYIPGFEIPGMAGNIYRLLADVLTVSVLLGMLYFLIRRFVFNPALLTARDTTLLNPQARTGIRRDSAIVGIFILLHVGSRFAGESFSIASQAQADAWQPFASALASLWNGWSQSALVVGEHVAFWLALGLILAFIPYFPYSKHVHLFFAPINFLLKPERRSIGELSKLNFDDERVEQFGASKLSDLGWEQIMDAYACIMCYRCQQVCPAYTTGKILSPAALEINKRYALNHVSSGMLPEIPLRDLIPDEAVWACTSCGACVDICPVGNEPMRDILDIRRSLVLMENTFPKQLETAFRGMERTVNPWNISPTERMRWAEGLNVPTIEQNPEPEILWWVGCAPATDARAQKTAQAFAKILEAAGVNYSVLGQNEQCTGDSARRAGNEFLFNELATANVELLNEVAPRRIVTTCPHCLHTLKNEYPAFGGNYQVIHHTQLINELAGAGKLHMQTEGELIKVTFHDPCYLGRHNHIFAAPRDDLKTAGVELVEMPRHADKSFCCGAGGAQMWKEEEHGTENVNLARFAEAKATGAGTVAVGCPFCLTMLNDASKADGGSIQVKDVAELVAEHLK